MGHGAHYNTTKEKLAESEAHRTANSVQVEEDQVFVKKIVEDSGGKVGREDEMIGSTRREMLSVCM